MPTNAYHPIITNLTEERKHFQSPGIVLNYLQNVSLSLPDRSLSEETARNLTEVKLGLRGSGQKAADDLTYTELTRSGTLTYKSGFRACREQLGGVATPASSSSSVGPPSEESDPLM